MSGERLKLTLSFDGTSYHGWQVQNNAPTVQSTLQKALEEMAGHSVSVTGCSRTDAGVHANRFVCHTEPLSIPCERIPQALNAHLPADISVRAAESVPADFHARYSCIAKEYVYKICNFRTRDPFSRAYALFYPTPLTVDDLSFVGEELGGKHDFRAFMAQGSKIVDTARTVYYCTLSRERDEQFESETVTLRICADGFLYNMVRIIVGTYLDAARGKYKKGDITALLALGDRSKAGFTAPPHGLYLNRVFYSEDREKLEEIVRLQQETNVFARMSTEKNTEETYGRL